MNTLEIYKYECKVLTNFYEIIDSHKNYQLLYDVDGLIMYREQLESFIKYIKYRYISVQDLKEDYNIDFNNRYKYKCIIDNINLMINKINNVLN
jgi:hypothetical protein